MDKFLKGRTSLCPSLCTVYGQVFLVAYFSGGNILGITNNVTHSALCSTQIIILII